MPAFNLGRNGSPAEQLHAIHKVFGHCNVKGKYSPADALLQSVSSRGVDIRKAAPYFIKYCLYGTDRDMPWEEFTTKIFPLWYQEDNPLNLW